MHGVRLICWNATEAEKRTDLVRSAGYEVDPEPLDAASLRRLRDDPPSGVVIDLGRRPSQGRDLALALRTHVATRGVSLVLVGGDPVRVSRIRELLPDATYATWSEIRTQLQQAIAHPLPGPVVPRSVFDGYAGAPLPKKLGIKAHSSLGLYGAPGGFEETLGELPEGVAVERDPPRSIDLALWFVRTRAELTSGIDQMAELADTGGLWIAWRKEASGAASDVSQTEVREAGLSAGLVDFNVCSVDAIWSALRFTRRKKE